MPLDLQDPSLLRQHAYVNGQWCEADSHARTSIFNPATAEQVGSVPNMGRNETRRAIAAAPSGPRRIGLIGLGAGTLATYGRSGDTYRIYEINPQVFSLADTEFSFLHDSPSRIERVLGDARLALEREAPQNFDVLAVDAFSGDSVPIHLITAEAMDVYLRHMRPDGIVAFHVTNRFLALAPVVASVAQARGLQAVLVHDEPQSAALRNTDWVLVARTADVLANAAIGDAASAIALAPGQRPWTDDFNNLLGVLK